MKQFFRRTELQITQSTLDKSTMKTKECFFIDREDKILLKGPDDCVSFLEDEMTDSWIIHFKLIPEKIPELIFELLVIPRPSDLFQKHFVLFENNESPDASDFFYR
jgi:hypothetical protein